MLIDTIFKQVSIYRDSDKNKSDYEENLNILVSLEEFVLRGAYTKRVNKETILSFWKHKSANEIAEHLGLTKASVNYNKRKINSDLVDELGSDLGYKLADKDYLLIEKRLDRAVKREQMPKQLIPENYLKAICSKSETDLKDIERVLGLSEQAIIGSYQESFDKGLNYENELYLELSVLKEIYVPTVVKKIEEVDNSKLKFLIDILNGNEGTVKDRNALQGFLEED